MKLLFICSRNQWRSPTAEKIFRDDGYDTKSAGTEPSARIRINSKMLDWADIIFVMEKKHRDRLTNNFSLEIQDKRLVVLDISDEYTYMDEELVAMLRDTIKPYL